MRIHLVNILVEDQERALAFYTEKLGFVVKQDLPVGDDRWLTVVSAEDPDGVELLLEPNHDPAVPAREFQQALYQSGLPWTQFAVSNLQAEYERLAARGVHFVMDPQPMGSVMGAVIDDTVGNLIMLVETGEVARG